MKQRPFFWWRKQGSGVFSASGGKSILQVATKHKKVLQYVSFLSSTSLRSLPFYPISPPYGVCVDGVWWLCGSLTQHWHWHQCWKCVSDWTDKYRNNITDSWKRATLGELSFTFFYFLFDTLFQEPIYLEWEFWSGIRFSIIHAKIGNFLSVPKMAMFCVEVPSGVKWMRFHQGRKLITSAKNDEVKKVPSVL